MATDGKMRQKKLYSACLNLDLKGARLSDSYYYNSLPLCLIDAIYSIGVHYTSVENAVKNFCKNVDTPRISYMRDPNTEKVKYDCYKMEDLLKVLEKYSSSQYGAKDIFNDVMKEATKDGKIFYTHLKKFIIYVISYSTLILKPFRSTLLSFQFSSLS